MARLFDVKLSSVNLDVNVGSENPIEITVTNRSEEKLEYGITFSGSDGFDPSWFHIRKSENALIGTDETDNTSVLITIPESAPAKTYEIKPTVFDVSNPDERFTVGSTLTLTIHTNNIDDRNWFDFSLLKIIIGGVVGIGIAVLIMIALLKDSVSERHHIASIVRNYKKDNVTKEYATSFTHWKSDEAFERFVRTIFKRCTPLFKKNEIPQVDKLSLVITNYVSGVHLDKYLNALGRITRKSKAVYGNNDITECVQKYLTRDRSCISQGRPIQSNIKDLSLKERVTINDGDSLSGISLNTMYKNPACTVDLCYEQIVSRICAQDYIHDIGKKGLYNFSLSILNDQRELVWSSATIPGPYKRFTILTPSVRGRYIVYSVKGKEFFKLSELQAYGENILPVTIEKPLSFLTDGQWGSQSKEKKFTKSEPCKFSLGKSYALEKVVLYLSKGTNAEATKNRIVLNYDTNSDTISVPLQKEKRSYAISIPWRASTTLTLVPIDQDITLQEVELYGTSQMSDSALIGPEHFKCRQSSLYNNNTDYYELNAVDGKIVGKPTKTTADSLAFWEVAFPEMYDLSRVSLVSSYDQSAPLGFFKFECFDGENNIVQSFEKECARVFDRYDFNMEKCTEIQWARFTSLGKIPITLAEVFFYGKSSQKESDSLLVFSINQGSGSKTEVVRENVALNKKCSMSSVHSPRFKPENGVDGNTNNFFHSKSSPEKAWWKVTLDRNYYIDSIAIYNRKSCCQNRFANFIVTLLNKKNDVLYTIEKKKLSGMSEGFLLDSTVSVRSAKIELKNNGYLHLGEVELYTRVSGSEASITDGSISMNKDIGAVAVFTPDTTGKVTLKLTLPTISDVRRLILYTLPDKLTKDSPLEITFLDDEEKRIKKAYSLSANRERVVCVPKKIKECKYITLTGIKNKKLYLSEIQVYGGIQ